MRVLVVDDEAPARARLRQILTEMPEVEVVGEAANGHDALTVVAEQAPDTVLLDIRMPGMDGLETARHLAAAEGGPAVIFTTAYGEHALAAFEAQAVDYLLKPVRRERLAQALTRAARLTPERAAALEPGRQRTHLSYHRHGRIELVPVAEVCFFRAEQKYVVARHAGGEALLEEPLKALEDEFGDRFVRIHRNALVARDRLAALERDPATGGHRLRLRGCPDAVTVSRRQLPLIRQLLRSGRPADPER